MTRLHISALIVLLAGAACAGRQDSGPAASHAAPAPTPAAEAGCALPADTLAQPLIVFGNWIWDIDLVDQHANFFFTQPELKDAAERIPGFAERNPYFYKWLTEATAPGMHVYGEGYEDDAILVDALLSSGRGWVCCLPLHGAVPASALKVGLPKATEVPAHVTRGEYWLTPDEGFRLWPRPEVFGRGEASAR